MQKKEPEKICPADLKEWRKWLKQNHEKHDAVWLIYYKMKAGTRAISWSDAVEEALCFGWIDSKAMKVDDEKYAQFFSKRKASSTWSKINKDKVQRLIDEGRMSAAGLKTIETAKENGTWNILDQVEELIIPKDLEKAFKSHKGSKQFFMGLSKSVKKMMLQWITLAKREETRANRINEIAELAGKKMKPKQF